MPEISRDTPLKGYDQIVTMLLTAGDPNGVTRPQVATLVDALRSEGRGTEALAADLVFTMVDHVDHEKREIISSAHLDRARGFFAKTLNRRRGPLTGAEITLMSPTIRALLEIGQMLTLRSAPGRIPHRVPRQGMDHIADMLRLLARPDGDITRAERDLIVYELHERGRGTEGLAVRYFFNFIDHRSGQTVERITLREIDDAVEYSDLRLLRNKDVDGNGYSADEIESFSTTARAFLRVGQMIEAGLIRPTVL